MTDTGRRGSGGELGEVVLVQRTPEAAGPGGGTGPRGPDGAAFAHPALLYRDEGEYATGVGAFVTAALAASVPVLVAVPGHRLELLRSGLGTALDGAECADMTELGRNPGRILTRLLDFAGRDPGGTTLIVGEPIWPGRSPAEITEATRHEALINLAFAGRRATVLCPYDTAGLPQAVLADARRTHPVLIANGVSTASRWYTEPVAMTVRCDAPLPEPAGAHVMDYRAGQLASVRDRAGAWAAGLGLSAARTEDLVLAVGEAAGNSLTHGGGRGTLRVWAQDGSVIAEVRDAGRPADPLAGRARPARESAAGGRGLWIIHQLCDLVETRTTDAGFTIRMHLTRPTGHS